jgi:hypothetical protein
VLAAQGEREREIVKAVSLTLAGHEFNEPEEKSGGHKMCAGRTFDDADELGASKCTCPRHFRTRGVGGIGRRKGCVGEKERKSML